MFCVKCGSPLAEDARFCSKCGATAGGRTEKDKTAVQQSSPVFQTPVQPIIQMPVSVAMSSPQRREGKVVLWLLAVILIAGGYFVYQRYLKPEVRIERTVAEFVAAANRGDINGVLACFDPTYTKLLQGALDLIGGAVGYDLWDSFSGLADIASYYAQYSGEYPAPPLSYTLDYMHFYGSDYADVSITLCMGIGPDAETETVVAGMVKKGDKWYFNGKGFFW